MSTTKERSKPYDVQATCDSLGCDPMRILAEIATESLPCGVCKGAGRTQYQRRSMVDGKERTCEACSGSGKERIKPELRAKTVRELAKCLNPWRLVEPATERMREILNSSTDAVAIEAAQAILDRLEKWKTIRFSITATDLARIQRTAKEQGCDAEFALQLHTKGAQK